MNSLLDLLLAKSGCRYLSDLPRVFRDRIAKEDIENLKPEDFTLKNWNDALEYLIGGHCEFRDREAAKDCLIQVFDRD